MGATAQGLSALHNGAVPFLPDARQRPARCHQRGAGGMGAGIGRSHAGADRRHYDSQSVKTTEAGGPRGYDAGKKIKGRKRHVVTDTLGNMLEGVVHGADVQDRDGAPGLIERSCDAYPALIRLYADAGYAGRKLKAAVAHIDRLTIEIIRRSDFVGFVVLPRRWGSNVPWRGSTDAGVSPRTGRPPSPRPRPGW